MNKIFTITGALLLTFFSVQLKAQRREDDAVIKFDSVSHDLPNVKRWMFMPGTGKWEGDGKLPQFLQWASFKYKEQNYHVFIYQNITGHYKYPVLKEEYITDYQACFIVFNDKEFQDITDKLNQKKGKTFYFRSANNGFNFVKANTTVDNVIDDSFLKTLTNVMAGSRITKTNLIFAMNSQVLDGKEIVRFDRPAEPESTAYLLKKDYYEVPFSDFMNAMKMK